MQLHPLRHQTAQYPDRRRRVAGHHLSYRFWHRTEVSRFIVSCSYPDARISISCWSSHFASINSHCGLQLGRRDDIESLAYCLIFLHHGSLLWLTRDGKSPSFPTTLSCKQNFLADTVNGAHNIPIELTTIFRHACSLTFTEKPNYGYLHTILENAVETTEQPLPPRPTPDSCTVTSTPIVNVLTSTSKSIIFTPECKVHTKSKEITPRQV